MKIYSQNKQELQNASFRKSYYSNNKARKWGTATASFLIPGLGQVINEETPKGIAFFLGSTCNYLLFHRYLRKNLLAWIGRIGIGIWAAKDAYDKS